MPRSIPLRPAPLALSLSLFASFSAPALAADPVEQQMVVIGSRAPTSISELPGTVWVIEREQLDQQTQAGVPLKEALGQLIPGLDIGSQGRTNNGQNLRGRSVLVMIDGVSLNSSRGISRQFDSIDPFNIERIEVMSGASAVYGGGATGGIINIVTKKGVGGDTRFNTELGARSGFQSHEDHDLRAAQSISGGNDLFNGRLAIAYQKNGAAYDGSGDQVLTDITQTDLQYNRSVDLMGSLGFTFANGHSLDLGLQYYDSGYDGDRGLDLGRNFDALRGRAPYSIKGASTSTASRRASAISSTPPTTRRKCWVTTSTCRPTTATRRWPSIPSLPSATAIAARSTTAPPTTRPRSRTPTTTG